jgi:hypothetical protein
MPQQFLEKLKKMKKALFLISSANQQIESLNMMLDLIGSQAFQEPVQHIDQGNTNSMQRIKAA